MEMINASKKFYNEIQNKIKLKQIIVIDNIAL